MDKEVTVLKYKVCDFEGPLDMLLQLIAKHKLDICDIEIAVLLEQYMEQINQMQEDQMDISSEFLEMASRLVYIKSVSLLPKHEEAEELKKELEGQLLEYQECRRIAALLGKMATYDIYTKAPSKIKFDMTYTRTHQPEDIAKAFLAAAGRGRSKLPPPREAFSGIVERKIVSVSSRVVYVLRQLWDGTPVKYRSLFKDGSPKSELVATFLAVLELVKNSRIRVDGDGDTADVRLLRKDKSIE
ncbi:MAG: segregation/condensation protein A [Acutalibacteraceae bacterium]|nr:segregation/condensation protein A [Acutalibacteraceae bacterium]